MRWGNRNRISPPTSNNQNKHNIRNNGLQNTRHQEREESDPWGRNKRGEPYSCSSSPLERVLRRWCRERGTQAGHPELKSRAENLGRPRELVCKTEVPEERTSQRKSQRPAEDLPPVFFWEHIRMCLGKLPEAGKRTIRILQDWNNSSWHWHRSRNSASPTSQTGKTSLFTGLCAVYTKELCFISGE